MKNKEIEELLNTFKELINAYSPDTEPFTIDYDYEIKYSALESLLSHIEQLENNGDKAINFIKHIKSILKEYNYEPYRVNTALDDLLRMLGEKDE